MKTTNILAVGAILFFCSTATYASDFSGLFAFMFLAYIVGVFSVINTVFMYIFFIKKKYKRKNFAVKHAIFASLIPLIGCLLSVIDYSTAFDFFHLLFWNLFALLLTLLPLVIYMFHKNGKGG